MAGKEIEIKIDLQNEAAYRRLLGHFEGGKREIRQENFFFDTDEGDLMRHRWALRIRLEADNAEMTVKGPGERQAGLIIRPEAAVPLSKETGRRFIEGGISVEEELPPAIAGITGEFAAGRALRVRHSFINYRIEAVFEAGGCPRLFEIDRTVFADGAVDYELEVELGERSEYRAVMDGIADLFERLGIPLIIQEKSKFARARRHQKRETN